MEHSKYISLSVKCNKCSRGRNIEDEDFEKGKITCQNPECKHEFSVYDGLKNGLKAYADLFVPMFLASDIFKEIIDVKVGYKMYFSLPEIIKKAYEIELFPMGNFFADAANITKTGFSIVTSLPENCDKSLIGESSKIKVLITTKTEDYSDQWMHMLQYALDQLKSEEYLTCILFSEIAFEIYVDKIIAGGYRNIGLDEDSISRFLISAKLPEKVNPLMFNLYKVKLSNSDSWRNWENKVLLWRNKIAHGIKISATRDEAILAYETVVDSIFYFIEGVDNYIRQGIKASIK